MPGDFLEQRPRLREVGQDELLGRVAGRGRLRAPERVQRAGQQLDVADVRDGRHVAPVVTPPTAANNASRNSVEAVAGER